MSMPLFGKLLFYILKNVSVSSCFLMEIDEGRPQPSVFDDSVFGEYIGSLVQHTTSAWEPAVRTDVSQHRCRSAGVHGICHVTTTCGLCEQATMTRAQNSFVDEQLARIQTTMTPVVVFADHKTMAPRPASTYDLPRKKQNLPLGSH